MSNVVRSPFSFQAASHELKAEFIKAGYLQPALRDDADAITTAIVRLKEDLTVALIVEGVEVGRGRRRHPYAPALDAWRSTPLQMLSRCRPPKRGHSVLDRFPERAVVLHRGHQGTLNGSGALTLRGKVD